MDKIHFYCAICGENLRAQPESAGGFCDCPKCLRVVPIPGYPAQPGRMEVCGAIFSPDILAIEIKFCCECCGNKIQVDARCQGMTLGCPVCAQPTRVPAWSGALPDQKPARAAAPQVRLSPEECAFLSAPMRDDGKGLLVAAGR